MGKFNDDACFLFADPSFLGGAASAFDLGGTLQEYNVSRDEADADARALASDWAIVGKDIIESAQKFAKENNKEAA